MAVRRRIVALPGTTQPFAPGNPKVLTHTIVRSNQVPASGEIICVFCPTGDRDDDFEMS
jgi:hypothetical protein